MGSWVLRLSLSALGCVLGACQAEPDPALPPSPCEPYRGEPSASGETRAFSVVVLPDTQFYSERYPEVFYSQTSWIAEQRDQERIAFVLHEGDIVNRNVPAQWDVAGAALGMLDGVVPYVLAAGNHDLRALPDGRLTRDADYFNHYFPVASYRDQQWFCGTYEHDDLQNSYSVLDGGGRRWLVLALEFGARNAVLAWADAVLADYATLPAIVVTHAFMYLGEQRYDRKTYPEQQYSPHIFGIGGSVNDGEEMWRELLERHSNVQLVLSGHTLHPGLGYLATTRGDDSVTHQLLANYQGCPTVEPCLSPDDAPALPGGGGFLRVLRFSSDHRTIDVTTYSPFSQQSRRDPENERRLTLTLP